MSDLDEIVRQVARDTVADAYENVGALIRAALIRSGHDDENVAVQGAMSSTLAALRALEGAGVVQRWRPIGEAKKDGKPVIVFHPRGGVCEAFCPSEGWAWHCLDGVNTKIGKSGASIPTLTAFVDPPTHFMPLPAPPVGGDEP